MTEFGGIAYPRPDKPAAENEWGYSGIEPTQEAIARPAGRPGEGARARTRSCGGFCYTQLTDVEQEINGLLTYDRRPKADLELIKKIIEQ